MAKRQKPGPKKKPLKERARQVNFYVTNEVITNNGGMTKARTKCKKFLEDGD